MMNHISQLTGDNEHCTYAICHCALRRNGGAQVGSRTYMTENFEKSTYSENKY